MLIGSGVHPVGLQSLGQAVGAVVTMLTVLVCLGVLVGSFLAERRRTGEPSFVTTAARRFAQRTGSPLWAGLPYVVVLAGLALGLVGWRAASVGGLIGRFSVDVALVGLGVAALGGMIATALAHPPRSVAGHAPADVAEPVHAHLSAEPRRLGTGPVGAVAVSTGAIVAVLAAPVATIRRAIAGAPADASLPAQGVVLAGVLVACAGAWLLHVEGVRVGSATDPAAVRLSRLGDLAGAVAVLAGLSVAADAGVHGAVLGVVAVASLLVLRLRTPLGTALLALAGWAVLRVVASVVVLSLDGLLPALLPFAVAALVAEVLGGLVLPAIRSRRRGGTPGAGVGRGPRSAAPLG